MYPRASQNKRHPKLAASWTRDRSPGRDDLEPALLRFQREKKISVSFQNSRALPESPAKDYPMPIEKQTEASPASLKPPTDTQTPIHYPGLLQMKLGTRENEAVKQPDISPVKESEPKSQEVTAAPKNFQEAEEIKSNVSISSRTSERMKGQTRFHGSTLGHAVNIFEETGTSASRTPAIPQSEELYTALRVAFIV